MMNQRSTLPVLVAGGGPVGLTTALLLAQSGVPVTVLEKDEGVRKDYRASTFHPATLDLLESCGITEALLARGLRCTTVQQRSWTQGKIAEFDHAVLANDTRHPYRLQCEQYKLSEHLRDVLAAMPDVTVLFGHEVVSVTQDDESVSVVARSSNGPVTLRGRYLVGSDGGRGVVRKAMDIAYEGFTYPERILVLGSTFDFRKVYPDLALINYLSDPNNYAHILRIPDLWRMSLPLAEGVTDEMARSDEYIAARLKPLMPGIEPGDIPVRGVYHVHQRVAASYRAGNVFLAGDAAHLNNPKGGMGLNGGLHDAVSLSHRLADAWHGRADTLGGYETQRRPEAIEAIHKQTEQNYKALKEADADAQQRQFDEWRRIASDPELTRAHLLNTSMINSLRRCGMLPVPVHSP